MRISDWSSDVCSSDLGLPTKTEQSDLYQAVYGRNGDTPMPVIAARSPVDAFDAAIEACRIAVQFMTPVMLLTDGYIANAAEPWAEIGRAHVCTPVTNAHLVCRLLLEKKKKNDHQHQI